LTVHSSSPDEIDVPTLYALLRLRSEVFVVEQRSAYLDLDGRDLDPGTLHCWIDDAGEPVAYLRLLVDDDGAHRISRVATAAPARGRGLGARLVTHALERSGRPVVLAAQAYLVDWYAGFGFEVDGEPFTYEGEDIVHVPMILR
jgi:ElaA protein